MALTAPSCRQTRNWWLLMAVVSMVLGFWLLYDGRMNQAFIEKHTLVDEATGESRPDSTLWFNQTFPPVFFAAAVLMVGWWALIKNRQVVADDRGLLIDGRDRIDYERIEAIDKTDFKRKGRFTVLYVDDTGRSRRRVLRDTHYDQLDRLLDHLVEKITGPQS